MHTAGKLSLTTIRTGDGPAVKPRRIGRNERLSASASSKFDRILLITSFISNCATPSAPDERKSALSEECLDDLVDESARAPVDALRHDRLDLLRDRQAMIDHIVTPISSDQACVRGEEPSK